MSGFPCCRVCVSFHCFSQRFPGFIARPFRGAGVGFEGPHLRLMVQFVEPDFLRIFHNSAYATHQGGLVLRYGLERPAIALFR